MEKKPKKKAKGPGSGKRERYIQPSILMGLKVKPSYGYELISTIQEFGFVKGLASPGMIYRHLRQLEEEGMVVSEWKTQRAGAAKRMYTITPEGDDVLGVWIAFMTAQKEKLERFIAMYDDL